MATLGKIIERSLVRIRQQQGLSTQPYTDELLAEMITHKFDVLFKRRYWDRHCNTETLDLTGTNGLIVTTVGFGTRCKEFNDIQHLWLDGYKHPLPQIPRNVNSEIVNITSYEPYSLTTDKIFRIRPITTTGKVIVRYRYRELLSFEEDDEVPFDDQCLILGTVYDYMAQEGANDKDTDKYKNMFEARLKQLEGPEESKDYSIYDYSTNVVSGWNDG